MLDVIKAMYAVSRDLGSATVRVIFVLACLLLSSTLAISSNLFDPETGYRIARYRTPTPQDVPGGTRIGIDEFDKLVSKQKAVVIDVMLAEGAGYDKKTGEWRLSKPRENIPGSVWLPDVGAGKLDNTLDLYFRQNLQELTQKDKTRAIIFYCMADCWMSWNAVKRAASYGYKNVYWYPEGTDGWRDWDRKFVSATPQPVKVAASNGTTKSAAENQPKASLPQGKKTVTLISADGARLDIADIAFEQGTAPDSAKFSVTLRASEFKDEFLSMRPFQCLPDTKEMWCHLAYPYETKSQISASDLQDLEYALLFLFKPPSAYGIDAWNGLYFKMRVEPGSNIVGTLHETDLNVLAVPPEKDNRRPIAHDVLSEVQPDAHRFARIEIH